MNPSHPLPESPAPAVSAVLCGPRVLLRRWRDSDLAPFAAMNADAEVMRYFPACLNRAQSDTLAGHIAAHFAQYDFGPWVLELPGVTPFAGFVGLLNVSFEAHFTPAVEIGWRLARPWWGQGYASEAARCALHYGFDVLRLDEIVAFTVPANTRSLAVMQRLGMRCDVNEDFLHPRLPAHHPLRLHRLYRIGATP